MKKCDIKGCKKKAEVFTTQFAFCREHWKDITNALYERGIKIAKERGIL